MNDLIKYEILFMNRRMLLQTAEPLVEVLWYEEETQEYTIPGLAVAADLKLSHVNMECKCEAEADNFLLREQAGSMPTHNRRESDRREPVKLQEYTLSKNGKAIGYITSAASVEDVLQLVALGYNIDKT